LQSILLKGALVDVNIVSVAASSRRIISNIDIPRKSELPVFQTELSVSVDMSLLADQSSARWSLST
jgi:hypothetical protein